MIKRMALVIGVGLAILLSIATAGFYSDLDWSGLKDHTVRVEPGEQFERGKTLWDWLDLLIVPVFLGGGAWWINQVSRENERFRAEFDRVDERERAEREAALEREIASDRAQDKAVQDFLDRMSDLLLKEGLRDSAPDDEVRTVARARTLTVLRTLDGERKGSVIRFLCEANLVQKHPQSGRGPVISLKDADLVGAELQMADLQEADLSGAKLDHAALLGANLQGANLEFADLKRANLQIAELQGANLDVADLNWADLSMANLQGVSLRQANLSSAKLRRVNLAEARFSEQTTLPDGTKWTRATSLARFTQPGD